MTLVPYRDSDLVVNLLSPRQGKLSAVINRGRKIGKSSSFTYQPGDLLDVEYQVKESTDFIRIINSAGKSTLNNAVFSYDRFLFHSYLLELITRISQPGNPSEDLYEILLENNSWVWKKAHSLLRMARFIWLLIQHGGFGIDYHTCGNCGKPTWRYNEQQEAVFRRENYRFQLNSGSLLCHSCVPVSNPEELISPAMLKVMWILDTTADFLEYVPEIPISVMKSVICCLNQYLLQRYEIRPKSLILFLESLDGIT